MKKILKHILKAAVRNDLAWFILYPVARLGAYLSFLRKKVERRNRIKSYAHLFPDLSVQNGPFKGMNYPSTRSAGSALYPKLIGSYERELWGVMKRVMNENYTEIINIGCGEGYYAVGLAMHTNARVFAYDPDERARELCRTMAEINGVSDQLTIRKECTARDLNNFEFEGKGLILSDCEGCERDLFTEANAANLRSCDLIIEVHDFKDVTISSRLINLFQTTHRLETIRSVDDIQKVRTYDFELLDGLDPNDKMNLLAENRIGIMEWLICWAEDVS